MSDFLGQYGLWLLIAILIVVVLLFLLTGRKKDAAAPIATPQPDPVIAAETASAEEAVIERTLVVEPVILAGGATPTVVTPIPEAPETRATEIPLSPAVTSLPDAPDNLLLLKGVGPKLATLLTELDVTSFAQIAAWTDTDLTAVDVKLGNFKGRPVRDQWIDQAKYLSAGDTAGFEAKYGKL